MSAATLAFVAHALALVLSLGAVATAIGALMARSLVSMCAFFAATGALVAAVLLALAAPEAGLAQALFSLGLAPVLMLAALALTSQGAKSRRGGPPLITIVAAIVLGVVLLWGAPELGARPTGAGADATIAPWLGPLVFVAASACVALLGYGERGALLRALRRDP